MDQQQFSNAVADFKALIIKGWKVEAALNEAETCNGLRTGVLTARLTRKASMADVIQEIRQNHERERFVGLLQIEIGKARKRVPPYKTNRLLDIGPDEKIAETLEFPMERALTEHELWMIEERLNPWLSEFKLARVAGVKPLRPIISK